MVVFFAQADVNHAIETQTEMAGLVALYVSRLCQHQLRICLLSPRRKSQLQSMILSRLFEKGQTCPQDLPMFEVLLPGMPIWKRLQKLGSKSFLKHSLLAPKSKVEIRIQIIPFSLAAYTSEESIKKVFYLQNKSLAETSIIRIDNLSQRNQGHYPDR